MVCSSLPPTSTLTSWSPRRQRRHRLAAISSLPGVRYAQLDGRAYANVEPNDEFWGQEWSPVTAHAPQAWDLTTGSPSVVVAVVDTGVDATQPDLEGRVLGGYDFVTATETPPTTTVTAPPSQA